MTSTWKVTQSKLEKIRADAINNGQVTFMSNSNPVMNHVMSNHNGASTHQFATGGYIRTTIAPNKPTCAVRKGGPRSRVLCEIYREVPHDQHMGRGIDSWFYWEDK